jgi:hypothetical protein
LRLASNMSLGSGINPRKQTHLKGLAIMIDRLNTPD